MLAVADTAEFVPARVLPVPGELAENFAENQVSIFLYSSLKNLTLDL